MKSKTVTLDVRDDFRTGRPPFARIMAAVSRLSEGQSLMLLAPFEPVPLFGIMEQQGFGHRTRQLDSGDWEVCFSRSIPATESGNCLSPDASPSEVEVDARGLEPPQPMVKVLEALSVLPPGAVLRALTDRRPVHLYAQLQARGFSGESKEQSDGSFVTHICRSEN